MKLEQTLQRSPTAGRTFTPSHINKLAAARGYTDATLAHFLGQTRESWETLKHGQRAPSILEIATLSELLTVPIPELFGGTQ